MNGNELIQNLKESGAMMDGHFLLTSGRHSSVYIEKFRLLENPTYLDKICAGLALQFSPNEVDVVLGAAIGGILLTGGVGRHLDKRNIFTERVDGRMELRRGFSIEPNQRVLIVEDIVTTGNSVFEMIEVVNSNNGEIVSVACLVDRSKHGIDFGVRKNALLSLPSDDWDPELCPLCKQGMPITARGRTGKKV